MINPDCNSEFSTTEAALSRSSSPIERWRQSLLEITGCAPAEIARKLEILLRFCAGHGISLFDECRNGPTRMARRAFYLRAARGTVANLVVQSYLIHNGVNVFGDLVCIPGTPDAIRREQGDQWKS